jgi:hypothetical protein
MTPPIPPSPLQGREPKARAVLMRKHGIKPESDPAVMRALTWLREQQPPGSWGEKHRGAMTGLALAVCLGHSKTTESPHFGITVAKAGQWVIDKGTLHDGRFHMADAFERNSDVYEHGIFTFALAEYSTMTKDERAKNFVACEAALDRRAEYLRRGRGLRAGYGYL